MEKLRHLEATLQIIKADASQPDAPPKFTILANAGSRMAFPDSDIVIDLAGEVSQKDARAIPILYGHDWDQQLGHATVSRVDDKGIWLEGVVSVPSERAREWVASAKAGFPWNASLGFLVQDSVQLADEEERVINGRTEKGPLVAATKIQIWECSVVTFGADSHTSADVAASLSPKGKDKEMPNNEDKKGAAPVPAPAPKNAQDNEELKHAQAGDEPKPKQASAEPTIEELRAARVAENKRIDDIEAVAKKYGDREFLNAAISEGWSADRFELETLRHARSTPPPPSSHSNADASKVAALAMIQACQVPVDEKRYSAAELDAADKIKTLDMRGIFEAATGFQPTGAQRYDGREWVEAASVSTYNLPGVLSTTANALLLNALGNYERRWSPLFKFTSVQDFRKVERWRLDSDMEFKKLAPGGEMEHGTQTESGWEIQAETFGRQYHLEWQDIINGDALGVFKDIMQQIALGAETKLNRDCWSLVLNPGNATDGTAFYHANHGSLLTGKALTLQNLSAAVAAFVSRKKNNGVPLGIEPRYLLVPPTLLATARNIVNASWVDSTATGLPGIDYNPMRSIVEIITAPQLEFSDFTGNSNSTWYLFADPNALAAFEITFLRGQQSPTVRSSELEIGRLGIAIDGHISFGVLAEDWRAALKVTA